MEGTKNPRINMEYHNQSALAKKLPRIQFDRVAEILSFCSNCSLY